MIPTATLSFFRFDRAINQAWAFYMMQFGHRLLMKGAQPEFYQLMGTGGGNGFSVQPDFRTYALFTVWSDRKQAFDLVHHSPFYQAYGKRAVESFHVWMVPIDSKGSWDGCPPFESLAQKDPDLPLAILTRATIRLRHSITFWKEVPAVSQKLSESQGLLFAKGMGEWPITRQATFSLWKNEEAMNDYAYQREEHQRAIRMTHQKGWYREEMFSRLQPFAAEGSFEGRNPLKGWL